MADIALRTYLQEIDELVNHSQSDEAIAHAKHILGFYPKLIEAYRLWAQALLEKQKHTDAADIFQRVLSSVPDDFISHVGMSIVREDEGNLDAAIWHMERAFEAQPGSSDIQAELKRLYGKRDGLEPPRVRLTRAALARLYDRGDHYPQALAELNVALSEEPDRIDLKVLKAQTHWHAQQRAEAAELSARILETLPYCREANRILARIWAEQGQHAESEVHSKKVEMLDPYEAFADPSENGYGAANVPAETIRLPRLDYVPPPEASQTGPTPDWMTELDKKQEEAPTAKTGAISQSADVPDWLAGVQSEALPETTADTTASSSATISPAEIPDWLEAPPPSVKAATGPLPQPESKTSQPEEDWLSAIADPNAAQQAPTWIGEAASEQKPGATGWLNELFGEGEAASAAHASTDTESGATPDWMQAEAQGEAGTTAEDDLPDWMKPAEAMPETEPSTGAQSMVFGEAASIEEAESSAPTVVEPESVEPAMTPSPATSDDDLPDWLKAPAPAERTGLTTWLSHLPTEASAETQAPEPIEIEPTITAAEVAPTLTEDSTAPAEAPAMAESTLAESVDDQIPEWMKSAGWTLRDPSIPLDSPTDFSAEDTMADSEPSDETAAPGEMPDWLKAMKPPAPDPETQARKGSADAPDWLRNLMEKGGETPAEATPAEATLPESMPLETAPSATEALASMFSDSASETPAQPTAEADLPEWLRAPTAEESPRRKDTGQLFFEKLQTGAFDKMPPPPELAAEDQPQPEAELPDWLRPPAEEPPAAVEPETALPDWLRPPAEETPQAISEPTAAAEPASMMPPDDADSALAWLESLALKRGANPEELVTNAAAQAEATSTSMPDWLRQPVAEEPAPPEPEPAALPDWLRPPVEAESPAEAATTAEPTASAEIAPPEWLRPPTSESAEPPPTTTSAPALDDTDAALAWLESLALKQGAKPEEMVASSMVSSSMVSKPEERSEAMPDWLKAAGPAEALTPAEPPASLAEEKPEWLKQMEAEADAYEAMASGAPPAETLEPPPTSAEPAMAASTTEERPDWLKQMEAEADAYEALATRPLTARPEAAQPAMAESEITPAAEAPEPTLAEKPEWLKQMEAESDAYETPVSYEASLAAPAQTETAPPADDAAREADAALAWLESLALKQGARPEELVSEPEAREAAPMPDWLKTESAEVMLPEEIAGAPAEAAHEAVVEPEAPSGPPTVTEEEALAWLESTKTEEVQAEAPEWLGQSPASAAPDEPQTVHEWLRRVPGGEMEADLPEWLQQHHQAAPPAPEPTVSLPSSEDEALAWLESLAAKQGANPDELISSPAARTEEAPEWVRLSAEATPAEPAPAPAAEPEPEIVVPTVPDWLDINAAAPPAEMPLAEAPSAEPEATLITEPIEPAPSIELPARVPAPKPKPPRPQAAPRPPKPPKAPRPKKSKVRGGEPPEAVLAKAREQLRGEQLETAIERYGDLISAGQALPEVISDLESANKRNPGQPELMRTLGDAYLKDNQLQRALDMYRLALQQL
jgi:tetratricopeptide (TPR) repeat protein